jgi:hypothetical protein
LHGVGERITQSDRSRMHWHKLSRARIACTGSTGA